MEFFYGIGDIDKPSEFIRVFEIAAMVSPVIEQ